MPDPEPSLAKSTLSEEMTKSTTINMQAQAARQEHQQSQAQEHACPLAKKPSRQAAKKRQRSAERTEPVDDAKPVKRQRKQQVTITFTNPQPDRALTETEKKTNDTIVMGNLIKWTSPCTCVAHKANESSKCWRLLAHQRRTTLAKGSLADGGQSASLEPKNGAMTSARHMRARTPQPSTPEQEQKWTAIAQRTFPSLIHIKPSVWGFVPKHKYWKSMEVGGSKCDNCEQNHYEDRFPTNLQQCAECLLKLCMYCMALCPVVHTHDLPPPQNWQTPAAGTRCLAPRTAPETAVRSQENTDITQYRASIDMVVWASARAAEDRAPVEAEKVIKPGFWGPGGTEILHSHQHLHTFPTIVNGPETKLRFPFDRLVQGLADAVHSNSIEQWRMCTVAQVLKWEQQAAWNCNLVIRRIRGNDEAIAHEMLEASTILEGMKHGLK